MPPYKVSLVHLTGNPNSREASQALLEANLLHEVITTIAYNPDSFALPYRKLLPSSIQQKVLDELSRRAWSDLNAFPVHSHPWKEFIRVALIRTGLSRHLGFGNHGPVDWVYTSLDSHVAKHHLNKINAIYGYEDGIATTFQAAKKRGILCLYDLPIPFYKTVGKIQREEAQRFPELASELKASQEPAKRVERKELEIQLADHIFVASSVTKKSLLKVGIEPQKISTIPYGAPSHYFQPKPKHDNVFRVLYVGRVAAHKGVHYLLQAWKDIKLPDAELLLVGVNDFPSGWLNPYADFFCHIPSVPHILLNEYYTSANVFVFPSLIEGFGMVVLEAMACGIPVITTDNVGSSDVIEEGIEGFVIPARDTEALKEKLDWCYSHPEKLAQMGVAARQKAEQLSWIEYRQKLSNQVQLLLSEML